jgi:hypothetical protein
VSFGSKAVFDGLVLAGAIPNDSRRYTGSILHHFYVDKQSPRIEIEVRLEEVTPTVIVKHGSVM